jgi:hypothetical protein
MRSHHTTALGLAATLLALCVAGCGSTSTQTGTDGTAGADATAKTAPTKAQFAAQAEAICHALNSQEKPLKARQEALKGLPTAEYDKDFVSVANQVVALSRAAAEKLKTLPRPAGDEATIEKAVATYAEEVVDVANISYAVANQESSAGEAAIAALKRSIATNAPLAEEFGLKDCTGTE